MKKFMLAVLLTLALAIQADSTDSIDETVVFNRPVPRDAKELRIIERASARIAERVIPCTVGIQVGNNHGSGVVITKSGYVLTAAHVTDRPGRRATISFPDGTTVQGKTLGLHTEADGALIKITDEGEWPFAPVVTVDDYPYPKPGDWCVATGHPGGFDEDRSPPVRLGRIIDVNDSVIRTDCTINSGDSGGPLFDMQGRVIGIHSRIAERDSINLHGPVLAFNECWREMRDGEVYPPIPASRFLDKLDVDRDGKITRAEQPEGSLQELYDRLAKKYEFDPEAEYTIRELADEFGWRPVPPSFEIRAYDSSSPSESSLVRSRFIRGQEVRAAFKSLAKDAKQSIIEVHSDGKKVALGTVIDGLVVTKASQLRDEIQCKSHDGEFVAVEIAHVDPIHDLAILQPNEALESFPVADAEEVTLGRWLVSIGSRGSAVSVGVASVAAREIEGIPGVLGVQIDTTEVKAKIAKVFDDSGAKRAGLQENDVIIKIMDKPVGNFEELQASLSDYRAGEVVTATIIRGDETIEKRIRLGSRVDIFFDDERFGSGRLNGRLSQRRDDFPNAIQHDSVLKPEDCGGPILDLDGKLVGINIARADRVATYALPIDVVRDLLQEHIGKTTDSDGSVE